MGSSEPIKEDILKAPFLKNLDLSPDCDPLDQGVWQTGRSHTLLHRGNLIRHAPKFDHTMIQIGDGERGARISVTWLAHRPGIEQIARSLFQRAAQRIAVRGPDAVE